jgi:hypothetical protein
MLAWIGGSGLRLSGSLPREWNVPTRNASFTGRDTLLVQLRQALAADNRVAVQALHGRGGVGKTQLAIGYAYRFAGEYELAWWIAAEDPALMPDQLAARTGAAPTGTPTAEAVQLLLEELRTRSRWLLVFDNAEGPEALSGFLPGGTGHVLITTWFLATNLPRPDGPHAASSPHPSAGLAEIRAALRAEAVDRAVL